MANGKIDMGYTKTPNGEPGTRRNEETSRKTRKTRIK